MPGHESQAQLQHGPCSARSWLRIIAFAAAVPALPLEMADAGSLEIFRDGLVHDVTSSYSESSTVEIDSGAPGLGTVVNWLLAT